jgi:hypothetical protein
MGDSIMPLQINGATSGSSTLVPTDTYTNTLTLPSGTGTLLSSANPQSGGVIQVVQAVYSTQTSSSSTSFADTGLTATITPKFNTSKILILISHTECGITTTSPNRITLQLVKNGSSLQVFNYQLGYNATANNYFTAAFNYLDSPATTSAITYKTQFANQNASVAAVYVQLNSMPSTITLLEIAA